MTISLSQQSGTTEKTLKMLTEAEFVERLSPKRVDQVPNGCWVACIAGLTTIPHSRLAALVPQKEDGHKDCDFHNAVNQLMRESGFRLAYIGPDIPWGFAIGSGTSPRGAHHAVIVLNGAVWHDPHPSRAGLETITDYEVVIPIRPLIPVTQTALCLNCSYDLSQHDPERGYCFHGGIGEDATTYEPRPAGWTAPPTPPINFDATGFDDL